MNRTDFFKSEQTDFPLTTETLDFLQNTYGELVNMLVQLGGDANYILYGCEVSGTNVSAGAVVIDGELLPFKAGTFQDTVVVYEVAEKAKYRDEIERDTYFSRYAECAVGVGVAFSSLKRLRSLPKMDEYTVPSRGVIMWSGAVADIPEGWVLCNGENGTPNLSGRFVVGYNPDNGDYDGVGKTGGADSVTLTESQMPVHSHDFYKYLEVAPDEDITYDRRHSAGGSTSWKETTESAGGDQPHENRPAYFVIAYIMKV